MARGRPRSGTRDLRHVFPLPSERREQPRFDGEYGDATTGRLRFDAGGSLSWNGEPGTWRVHAHTLHVDAPGLDCEGAIDNDSVYLVCGGADRPQLVLHFAGAPSGRMGA